MKLFIPIVQVLDRYKIRDIDILDGKDSTSRYTQLYQLLRSGELKTDEEVAKHFYGDSANLMDPKFRAFKSAFKDRLLNTLFFIDPSHTQFTDFQGAYYAAQREWGAIRILYARNLISPATELAERLLVVCIKYELTELCVSILDKLRSSYASQIGDKKKYEWYKSLFWSYKGLSDAEHLAQDAFEELQIEYVKTTAFRPENSTIAEGKLERLLPLHAQYDSFMFRFYFYGVKEAVFSAKHDYPGVIDVCNEALAYFRHKPFTMKAYIAIFLNQKVIAHLSLRQYGACQQVLDEVLHIQEVGNVNWFKSMEKKVILGFHMGDYALAHAAYSEASDQKEFKNLQDQSADVWKLFEAYLFWANSIGKPMGFGKGGQTKLDKFRLWTFLNDVPTFSDDKRGMNIPVLVVQIALMISLRKNTLLDKRIETIEKYLFRYARRADAAKYRTNLFIRLLLEIPRCHMNSQALEKRTTLILSNLKKVPLHVISTGYQMEIIPYEVLWLELIKMTDLNAKQSASARNRVESRTT